MINDPIPEPIAAVLRVAANEQAVRQSVAHVDGAASELQLAYLTGVIRGLEAAGRYLLDLIDDLQTNGFRGSDD